MWGTCRIFEGSNSFLIQIFGDQQLDLTGQTRWEPASPLNRNKFDLHVFHVTRNYLLKPLFFPMFIIKLKPTFIFNLKPCVVFINKQMNIVVNLTRYVFWKDT